jgi:hypothetical protein
MGYANLARAALIATIPTLYTLGSLQLWHVFVLALLAGAFSPAPAAGVRAFVPHLVDDAALDRANALTATSLQAPSGSARNRIWLRRISKLDEDQHKILHQLQLQLPERLDPIQIQKCSADFAAA